MTACKPRMMVREALKHRSVSIVYQVTVDGCSQRVCRQAFTKLHEITPGKVEHIVKQVASGASGPRPHAKGKHNNRPSTCSQEARLRVCEHINSFPADESHYSRHSNAGRKYLSSELNINKMFNLYRLWCAEKQFECVSARTYRDIFNSSCNLGFGHPRSDTCSVCDAATSTFIEDHKLRASQAFAEMRKDRLAALETDGLYFATFDMEKTLPLPKISTSVAFYLRQLWLYNLGIHLVRKGESKAYFHIWSEDEGLRGCEEVASGLLTFFEASNLRGGHLTVWSDSCGGQNKNFYILSLWQYLILRGLFKIIDHKFPEPGHSYMDSDRDFAKVEKEVRSRQCIYSVDEYHSIMAKSQVKTHVTRMANKFFEIKQLPQQLGLTNRNIADDGSKVLWKDIRWIRVNHFGTYMCKKAHDENEAWRKVNLMKSGHDVDLETIQLIPRDCVKSGVKTAKIADIRKQLQYIPACYKSYYEKVISAGNCNESNNDCESSCDEDSPDMEPCQTSADCLQVSASAVNDNNNMTVTTASTRRKSKRPAPALPLEAAKLETKSSRGRRIFRTPRIVEAQEIVTVRQLRQTNGLHQKMKRGTKQTVLKKSKRQVYFRDEEI